MVCGGLDGRGVWGRMDTCICMAEFLCYLPETVKTWLMGFPSGSDSKASAYNAGDPCSIPGLGRSPVHHQLPEPAQTHVHQVGDAI